MASEEEFVDFAAAVAPRLRRMAFLLRGDWHAAEDLVQTTLAKVFVSWRKIRRGTVAHQSLQAGLRLRRRRRERNATAGVAAVAVIAAVIPAVIGGLGHSPAGLRTGSHGGDGLHRQRSSGHGDSDLGGHQHRGPAHQGRAGPRRLAISPDGKTVYVADVISNTVTPISAATNTPGPAIKTGHRPVAIDITPDGKTAYVVSLGAGTVTDPRLHRDQSAR